MGDSLRMSIVLPIIESLKNAKSYHKAIDLINKEVRKMENVDNVCSLLELLAHCYCGTFNDTDYDKAFEALCRCRSLQGDDYEFQNAESYFIFGHISIFSPFQFHEAGKFKRGMLDDALVACTIGLNKPQIEPELKHALECSITKITKEIEAEKLARDEAKKLIEAEEREKKKAEDTQNKMRQKKEKMKNVENVTKVMEENLKEALKSISDMEIREDGGTSTILPEWQPREFNVPFNGILEKKSGRNCFIGSIQSELCKLPKSFVEASSYHFDKCDELVTLCSNYECLLNVEHLILNPIDMSEKLLVTEIVYSIEEFFSLKYQKLKSSNIFADETSLGEMWWDHISGMFWRIFRDVARGLMFLHEKTNYACGDLSFNTFVTFGGRGRILPSLDKSKKGEEDVTQFVQLLNNIVYFPFVGKSTPVIVLPSDLSRLLDFIPRMQRVPTYFLVNHPFFWTVQEKIDFALKLKKFIKKTKHTEAVVQKQMRRLGAFKNWWNGLAGVYFKIWNTAQLKKTITSYKREVDIVRFFNAAYSHVNDGDYKIDRKWKKLTDVEIERNLEAYFPDYCVTIFGCLCVCMNNRSLRENELKDVNHLLPS